MKKMLLSLVVILVLVVAGAAYWLHGNVEGLLQSAIGKYGSAMTGASVKVAGVQLQTTDGRGALKGLVVGNPAGFKTPFAVKADTIELEVDVASLAKDVVVVKKVAVIAPELIYEKGEAHTNFDAIQKNIAQYLGPSNNEAPGKKIIVQELVIRNAKAQASAAFMNGKTVTMSLPDIHLRDLGKAKGGISPGELGQEVTNAIERKLTSAISFDKLMGSVGNALGKAGEAIKGIFK
ncbi:hypothetical protein [Rhodoferax aquaticus]|uniref:AsmA family protein n=1 Tax=Rhodoferax aquaticus TaxID=2527691 RepID=A0A515EMP5_9BURK|nr:hypothetical protein [Rhodoferax aquaticus]QDL53922.1 hypothetical protein EXZ61_06935 [Rhodoferax aquaticus]